MHQPVLNSLFEDSTGIVTVNDPSSLLLKDQNRLYYLAHFNAHRARYSAQPPPVEPPPWVG